MYIIGPRSPEKLNRIEPKSAYKLHRYTTFPTISIFNTLLSQKTPTTLAMGQKSLDRETLNANGIQYDNDNAEPVTYDELSRKYADVALVLEGLLDFDGILTDSCYVRLRVIVQAGTLTIILS